MKYQALRKILGEMGPDMRKGIAYGAGGAAGLGALGAGAYDLATPDTFGQRLADVGGEAVESLGDYLADNPSAWLSQLSLLGGSALGSGLERRAFRNEIENERR